MADGPPLANEEQKCRFCSKGGWHLSQNKIVRTMAQAEQAIRTHESCCPKSPHYQAALKILEPWPTTQLALKSKLEELQSAGLIPKMEPRALPPELLQYMVATAKELPEGTSLTPPEDAAKALPPPFQPKPKGYKEPKDEEPEDEDEEDDEEEEEVEPSDSDDSPQAQGGSKPDPFAGVAIAKPGHIPAPAWSAPPQKPTFEPQYPADLPFNPKVTPPMQPGSFMPGVPGMPQSDPTLNVPFMALIGAASLSQAQEAVNKAGIKDLALKFLQGYEAGMIQINGSPTPQNVAKTIASWGTNKIPLQQAFMQAISNEVITLPGLQMNPWDQPQPFLTQFAQQGQPQMPPWQMQMQPQMQQPPMMPMQQPQGGATMYPPYAYQQQFQQQRPPSGGGLAEDVDELVRAKFKMQMVQAIFGDSPMGQAINPNNGHFDPRYYAMQRQMGLIGGPQTPMGPMGLSQEDVNRLVEQRLMQQQSQFEQRLKDMEREKQLQTALEAMLAPMREKLAAAEASASKSGQSDTAQAMTQMQNELRNLGQTITSTIMQQAQAQSQTGFGPRDMMAFYVEQQKAQAEALRRERDTQSQLLNERLNSKDKITELILQMNRPSNGGDALSQLERSWKLFSEMGLTKATKPDGSETSFKEVMKEVAPMLQPLANGLGQALSRPSPPSQGTNGHGHAQHAHTHQAPVPASNAAAQQIRYVDDFCFACGGAVRMPVGVRGVIQCQHCLTRYEGNRVTISDPARKFRADHGIMDDNQPAPQGLYDEWLTKQTSGSPSPVSEEISVDPNAIPETGLPPMPKTGGSNGHNGHTHHHAHAPRPRPNIEVPVPEPISDEDVLVNGDGA